MENNNKDSDKMNLFSTMDEFQNSAAVLVRNGIKSYDRGTSILNCMDMTVPTGSIYGLLGASGCGKTTLLSCIVGLKCLDSGEVQVFGKAPGSKGSGIPGPTIGYMSQEIALQSVFTISEVLQYYGRILGMQSKKVEQRTNFLVDFLDLPGSISMIKNCSGGQQRRISLAVALLNQPRLLVLDEPTVGIDPTIRENIWKHLREVVEKEKTTVIISTHYINEAQQSNYVGIMRSGRLIAETTPDSLLSQYNSVFLEDVFFKLCYEDEHNQQEISHYGALKSVKSSKGNEVQGLQYRVRSKSPDIIHEHKIPIGPGNASRIRTMLHQNYGKISAVFVKNILNFIRVPVYVMLLVLIPPSNLVIINEMLGLDPANIPMGFVNHDIPNVENPLDFCKHQIPGCFSNYSSCQLFNGFKEMDIRWFGYADEEEALESIHRGETLGYISIPENYSDYLLQRSILKNFVDNETLEGTTITGRLDHTQFVKTQFVTQKILQRLQEFIVDLADLCGTDGRAVEIPLKFDAVLGSIFGATVNEFMQPGCLGVLVFLLAMASSFNLVAQRKDGTLDRSLVAGLGYIHIISGFLLTEGMLIIMQLGLSYGVCTFFEVKMVGSTVLYLIICFFQGIVGLAFGFLFGFACNNQVNAGLCIMAVFFPLLVNSGTTWPVEGQFYYARMFTAINPVTKPVEALRSIMNRGWTATHPVVMLGVATQFVWIFLIFGITACIQRFENK